MSPFDEFEPLGDDSVIDADFDRPCEYFDDESGYPSFDDEEIDALFAALKNPEASAEFGNLGRLLGETRAVLFQCHDVFVSTELAEYVDVDESSSEVPAFGGDELAREVASVDVDEMLRLFTSGTDDFVAPRVPSITRIQRALAGASLAVALVGGLVGAQHLRPVSTETIAGELALDPDLADDESGTAEAVAGDADDTEDAGETAAETSGTDWAGARRSALYGGIVSGSGTSTTGSGTAMASALRVKRFGSAAAVATTPGNTVPKAPGDTAPKAPGDTAPKTTVTTGSAITAPSAPGDTAPTAPEDTGSGNTAPSAPEDTGSATTAPSAPSGTAPTAPGGIAPTAPETTGPDNPAPPVPENTNPAPPVPDSPAPPAPENTNPEPTTPDDTAVISNPDTTDSAPPPTNDSGPVTPVVPDPEPPALEPDEPTDVLGAENAVDKPVTTGVDEPVTTGVDKPMPGLTGSVIDNPDENLVETMGGQTFAPATAGAQVSASEPAAVSDPIVGETTVVAAPAGEAVVVAENPAP